MQKDSMANNQRIAKNTLMLYLRMFITLPIALYISRILLDALGVIDYGVYNAVGGVVALFYILTGSLSVSISRYITYELGKESTDRLNVIFCTSLNVLILLSVLIVIVAETLGVWFLNTQMNLPSDSMVAANWVLQFSLLTFVINLISVPYNALIVAHERMSAFAYIGILECLLKFGIACLLYVSPINRLIFYASLLAVVSICIRLVYGVYCDKNFVESKYHLSMSKSLVKEMSQFVGWVFFGNGVVVLKDQGTNLLLNIFKGPVVNAAQGIAIQVNGVVMMFVTNFLTAVHPQITKTYSANELIETYNLIIRASKMSFFILLILFVPIVLNLDYLLNLWLVDVPDYTSQFIALILMASLIQCFNQPLLTGVLACGKIKAYEIGLTIIYLIAFILNYVLLKMSFTPSVVFIVNAIATMFVLILLLSQARVKIGFPIKEFLHKSFLISIAVAVVSLPLCSLIRINIGYQFVDFLVSATLQVIVTGVLIMLFGLSRGEQSFIASFVKRKIHT